MKLPGHYGDFLTHFHFHFVNPSALKVNPDAFGFVAIIPDRLPWIKVALLSHCYMCSPELYEEVGLVHYANRIQKR